MNKTLIASCFVALFCCVWCEKSQVLLPVPKIPESSPVLVDESKKIVLDTGMTVVQIVSKIDTYMQLLESRAWVNTLVAGNNSAHYRVTNTWDLIDLTIGGRKTTIAGIHTQHETTWENTCEKLEKQLDCDGKNDFCWALTPKNDLCEMASVDDKKCFTCLEGGLFINDFSDVYSQMLDFSPSGKYILIDTHERIAPVAEPHGTVLLDTKTWKKVLDFTSSLDPSKPSFESWTPDASQFIYISRTLDENWWQYLNITQKDLFPKTSSLKLEKNVIGGWNDDKYVYLLSEDPIVKNISLMVFSIHDLKEVFSSEIHR